MASEETEQASTLAIAGKDLQTRQIANPNGRT
jgi:hypothetical protein